MNDSAFDSLSDSALIFNREPGDCRSFSARPVLPTSDRVCAWQTTDLTRIDFCCSEPVERYECWAYCKYTKELKDFVSCMTPRNATTPNTDVYCQSNTTAGTTERLTSSGFRRSMPKFSWMLVGLIFTMLFAGHANALIIPSLDTHGHALARRQNSECTFDVDQRFTRSGPSHTVVNLTECIFTFPAGDDAQFCSFIFDIDSGLYQNNRTINDTSAAEPEYDQFFEIVSNKTGGRMFPALSQVNTTREHVATVGNFTMIWTLYQYCVNGTASNCDGVLSNSNDPMVVEACGPLFLDDGKNGENATIIGSITPVVIV